LKLVLTIFYELILNCFSNTCNNEILVFDPDQAVL